jgi:hypothetical protein
MRRTIIMLGAAIAVAAAAPVAGQTLAPPASGQDMRISADVGVGYDDDVFGSTGVPVVGAPIATNAGYGVTTLSLNYAATGRRSSFGAAADTAARFYRLDQPFTARSFGGSAGVSTELVRRLTATAAVASQRASHHTFWMFPTLVESPLGQITPPSLDYSLSAADGYSIDASGRLSYRLTSRSSLSAEYGHGFSRYGNEGQNDFEIETNRASGRYQYQYSQYSSVRLGYGIEEAEYDTGLTYRRRIIDVGIDYSRPLSLSRRTTFSFGVGSTGLDDGRTTTYTVTGRANLNHQLSRNWVLHAGYDRNVGFINGFLAPVQSDGVIVGVNGIMNRRVQVTATAGYANGAVGPSASNAPDYLTYTGSGRVQILLGKGFWAYGEYVYYHYSFDDLVTLPLLTPRLLDRQGIRGGVNYTVAVF